jgi:hypothetical protein
MNSIFTSGLRVGRTAIGLFNASDGTDKTFSIPRTHDVFVQQKLDVMKNGEVTRAGFVGGKMRPM